MVSGFFLLRSRSAPRRWLLAPPSPAWTSGHLLPCLNLLGNGEQTVLRLLGNRVGKSKACPLASAGSYFGVLRCLGRFHFQGCPRLCWSRSRSRSSESSAPTEPSASSPADESGADYGECRRPTCHFWLPETNTLAFGTKKRWCFQKRVPL